MIDRHQLQSIGLTPEAAQRAQHALQGGDLRGFVHELLLIKETHAIWNAVADAYPHEDDDEEEDDDAWDACANTAPTWHRAAPAAGSNRWVSMPTCANGARVNWRAAFCTAPCDAWPAGPTAAARAKPNAPSTKMAGRNDEG